MRESPDWARASGIIAGFYEAWMKHSNDWQHFSEKEGKPVCDVFADRLTQVLQDLMKEWNP